MTETTASASSLMQTKSDDKENELVTVQLRGIDVLLHELIAEHCTHGQVWPRLNKHDTLDLIERICDECPTVTGLWLWIDAKGPLPLSQLAEADFATIGVIRIILEGGTPKEESA